MADDLRTARHLRMARPRQRAGQRAAAAQGRIRRVRRRTALRRRDRRGVRQSGLRMRHHPARHRSGRTTASCSARSARRRRRWAPAWCRAKAPAPPIGPMAASASTRGGRRHERHEPIGRKLDLRNGRVDLSHGAGGRAMAQLIAEIFHAAFDNDWLRRGNDQAAFDVAARAHGDDDRRLCRLAAVLSRRRHRLARRARHHQRRRHGGRAAAVSVGELHHRGGLSARRSASGSRRAWARPRARPACRSSPATPRWSSAARPTACSSRPPASASCRPASICRATRRGRATWCILSGSIGDHGVAVMSKRAESRLRDRDRLRLRARCTGWSPRWWRRPARRCG